MSPLAGLFERIDAKVMPEPNAGCWLWTGATTTGYGVVGRGRRGQGLALVHRVQYERYREPISTGMEIDHLCRVRLCGNPWHLEVVTKRVNILRGESASAIHARKTTCPRGHHYDYTGPDGSRRCRRCDHDKYIRRRDGQA